MDEKRACAALADTIAQPVAFFVAAVLERSRTRVEESHVGVEYVGEES